MNKLLLVISIISTGSIASAHGGGLDRNGCHHDRQRGGYHCHRSDDKEQKYEIAAKEVDEPKKSKQQFDERVPANK